MIAARVLKELNGSRRVAIGPGVPEAIIPSLADGVEVLPLSVGSAAADVDVAVVEAIEVSAHGDLALKPGCSVVGLNAERWIVAGRACREDGEPVLVKECRFEVQKPSSVDLIVTEYGVIRVGKVGFELVELSPGSSSDDLRTRVRGSLHVVDNISTLRI